MLVLIGDYRGRDGLLEPPARAELARRSLPGDQMTIAGIQVSPRARSGAMLPTGIIGLSLAPRLGAPSVDRGSAV